MPVANVDGKSLSFSVNLNATLVHQQLGSLRQLVLLDERVRYI